MLSLSAQSGDIKEDDIEDNLVETHDAGKTISIPDILLPCLKSFLSVLPPHARFLSHLTIEGITYSVSSKHIGNSSVLISDAQDDKLVPARIDYIIQLPIEGSTRTIVAIRRYNRAQVHDPFSKYPVLRTELYNKDPTVLEIVSLSSIQCHFASCPFHWQKMMFLAVISLNRVCPGLTHYFST